MKSNYAIGTNSFLKVNSMRFFYLGLVFSLLISISSIWPAKTSSSTNATGVKEVNSINRIERFMVADIKLSSSLSNPRIDYHAAANNTTILEMSEPWEKDFYLGGILGVIKDNNGHLKMYYAIRGFAVNSGKRGVAMAISTDNGMTWQKPILGNLSKNVLDDEKSNLISIPFDKDVHLAYDRIEARAIGYYNGLYVMVAGESNNAYGFTSKDGINWNKSGYIGNIRTDGNWNVFYDTIREDWKIYGRIRGRSNWESIIGYDVSRFENNPNPTTRRGISLSRSKNFTDSPWEEVSALAMDPQDYWEGWKNFDAMGLPTGTTPDFYVGSIYEYFGQYIGFPPTFFQDRDRINLRRERIRVNDPNNFDDVERNRRWDGPIFPVLVLSRDGRDFYIPFKNNSVVAEKPYLRVSQQIGTTQDPEKPEVGQLQSTQMVLINDEIHIYFLHTLNSHYEEFGRFERSLERTTIKLDRFASVGANQIWLSERVLVPENAKNLVLNSSGNISVCIRDTKSGKGDVIPGFNYENSIVPIKDSVNNKVEWKDISLEELKGYTIRIEVMPHYDGRFYGFSFSD